ncbi:MAG TPA: thermonuclease family protein [Desulfomonilaceae bacterium]|nr:thermonuclease family protein [Desulfomonilaceae bacterium]
MSGIDDRAISRVVFLLVMCAVSLPACGASWSGTCVGVSDGDTIRVMRGAQHMNIRLYGIDCPERGQDFGNKARRFTGDMTFGKTVGIEEMDRDPYGRIVAWVWVNGTSLNTELLKNGLAWWYRQYAPENGELRDLESSARKAKIGLWSHPNPLPPWEFRKKKRKR